MTHYDRLKRKRLGDVLVDEGLATEEEVIAGLQEQQQTGKMLSDILFEGRKVGEYDIARAIVEHCQAPFIDLRAYTLHKDLIQSMPARLLHGAGVVPMEKFGDQISFACQEIPSDDVANKLKEHSPGGIYIFIASSVDIRAALHNHAPLTADTADEPKAAAPVGKKAAAISEEDQAWKELFDHANESILTELTDPDDE
ncbi:MAG: GspE/PulE/PilB domain-containing protein [Planctomycetota bacterium]|jgi:type IV pilus assembly protein PilB